MMVNLKDVPYSHLFDMHYNAKCNVIQFRIHHYKSFWIHSGYGILSILNYLSWILNRSLIFKFQDFMYRSVKLYFFHQFIVLNNEQILCSKTSVILLTLPSTIWYVNYCVILNSIATCKAILLVMYLPALLKTKSGSFFFHCCTSWNLHW